MPEITTNKSRQKVTRLCGVIGAIVFIPLVSNILTSVLSTGLSQVFYSRISFWMEVLLLFGYAHYIEKGNLLLWEEKKYTIKFYLLSLLTLLLLQFVARIVSAIPVMLGAHNDLKMVLKVIALVKSRTWAIALVVLTAGFTEEIIFRGYIQPRLALFFSNKYIPIVIIAMLFSALHYRYFSIVEIIFTFLFGLLTAAYYEKYRSLIVLVALHVLIDFGAIMLAP